MSAVHKTRETTEWNRDLARQGLSFSHIIDITKKKKIRSTRSPLASLIAHRVSTPPHATHSPPQPTILTHPQHSTRPPAPEPAHSTSSPSSPQSASAAP